MGAIHGEHLKPLTLDVAHPTGDLRGRAVPGNADRILVRPQTRLARGERGDRTERDPRLSVGPSAGGSEDVSHDRDADERGSEHVEGDAKPEQEATARGR